MSEVNTNKWEPSPKQAAFLTVPYTVKEAAYLGGAGSGKSDVLLMYPIVHRFHEHPRFKQVFLRRTFPELRNEIVPRSKALYKRFGGEFSVANMCWTFPSGAMVFLGHCEHESDVSKYDSMEINLFTPDEITSLTEFIYLYIAFTRVRTSDPALPAIVRGAGMPGGIGHGWVKKRFIDPYKPGGKIIKGKGGNKRIFIHSTYLDNPRVDPNYGQSLDALNEAERRAKKFGDFDAYLGQVFEEFRDRHYPDEPENALHVIEPFDIPKWWPKINISDWGYKAQTYSLWGAISPSRRLYLYREMSWRQKKIEEWAPYVRELNELDQVKQVKICKSAGQEHGQEHTIRDLIETALGTAVELTNNNPGSRITGKAILHEYLRWKQKYVPAKEQLVYDEEFASFILRNRGLEEYKKYLGQFNPPAEETNIPKLQIFKDCCPLLVDAIKSCIYAKPIEGKPVEDVQQWDGDDPYDVVRYMVDAADKYFDEAEKEFEKIQQQDIIMKTFEKTGDWNYLYRNARMLESSSEVRPVRRYHGR